MLVGHGYRIREQDTGGYACRKITGGTQPSLHSYGIAADVNWQTNPYLKTPNRRTVRFFPPPRNRTGPSTFGMIALTLI